MVIILQLLRAIICNWGYKCNTKNLKYLFYNVYTYYNFINLPKKYYIKCVCIYIYIYVCVCVCVCVCVNICSLLRNQAYVSGSNFHTDLPRGYIPLVT